MIGRLTGRGTKGLSVAEHCSAAHNGPVAGSSPAGPPADQCINRFFHFLSISVPHQEHLVLLALSQPWLRRLSIFEPQRFRRPPMTTIPAPTEGSFALEAGRSL